MTSFSGNRKTITKVIRQQLGLLIRSLYAQRSYDSAEITGLDIAGVDMTGQENEGPDTNVPDNDGLTVSM